MVFSLFGGAWSPPIRTSDPRIDRVPESYFEATSTVTLGVPRRGGDNRPGTKTSRSGPQGSPIVLGTHPSDTVHVLKSSSAPLVSRLYPGGPRR
ncbi:hypothetical protein UO65_4391 [Actinokineospora spheciospongiae]|uniref:Uncharacterized protein n=1 Tax=Actinokineospora spheciospongiae TaxID=909613 RepID=W7IJ30_9PSEU|nr:hypothetical protein UO65_4391 [Actinokineospora spheciospongiae]